MFNIDVDIICDCNCNAAKMGSRCIYYLWSDIYYICRVCVHAWKIWRWGLMISNILEVPCHFKSTSCNAVGPSSTVESHTNCTSSTSNHIQFSCTMDNKSTAKH
jgi:hypothetical protein